MRTVLRLQEQIYARLLQLALPRRFHDRFGMPMRLIFRDQLRAARSTRQQARLWLGSLSDLLETRRQLRQEGRPLAGSGRRGWVGQVWYDLRFAVRAQRGGGLVTLLATVSLAVAIGGNATVFSLVKAALFAPTSVVAPERVALVQEVPVDAVPIGLSSTTSSLATSADLRVRSQTAAAWVALRNTSMALRGDAWAVPVNVLATTDGFFDVIGVPLARGRGYDSTPDGRRGAVIRPEFWARQGRAGRDPIGQTLVLDGEPYEIIGVLPAGFRFAFTNADVYLPLTDSPTSGSRTRRDVVTLARLKDGVDMERFEAELQRLADQLRREHAAAFGAWTLDAVNLRTDIPGASTVALFGLLQGTVAFVLIIACTNITNLLLARGQGRAREIALRIALGASRARILRQGLMESTVIAAAGTVLGLGCAALGLRLMAGRTAIMTADSGGYVPEMDWGVVAFTLVASVLVTLAIGVAPALRASQQEPVRALRDGGWTGLSRRRRLISSGLVVCQIALALVALGGGGMLAGSLLHLRHGEIGFDPRPILTAQVRVPASTATGPAATGRLHAELLDRVRALPGVRAAALVSSLPRGFRGPTASFRVLGRAGRAAEAPVAFGVQATPGYLDTYGIELLRGRFFEPGDRDGAAPVIVVSRSFADTWFPGASGIGELVEYRGEDRTIVGVIADVRQSVSFGSDGEPPTATIYEPVGQSASDALYLTVRASGDPRALADPLRRTVNEIGPDLALAHVLTLEQVRRQTFTGVDVFTTILAVFGLLALLLSAGGTYGVLSHSVQQRRHEIAVRMAIGARRGQMVRLLLKQGVALSLVGVALGGVVLVPLTGILRAALTGIVSIGGGTAIALSGILLAVTVLASLVPAWGASRQDALRTLGAG